MEEEADEGTGTDRAQLAGVVIAGKYWLEHYIGSGSTGAVYRARHNVLEKPIALKILEPDLARDPQIVELFKREAKAASRLDHPNSVRILDFGADVSGLLYIAMEFVQGPDLLQVLDEQFPLSYERVVTIMLQLLGALAQAHELGVVHRDIKPENVLVLSGTSDDGHATDIVKVCDFGVAQLSPAIGPTLPLPRVGPEHPTVIDANVLVGTPEYMSPEQARGEPLDPRSDVYSAGVVLFQLLTNRVPFTAPDVAETAMLQCYAPPPRPASLLPVDSTLEAICLKAMSKDPAQRYQNAREMRAALKQAASERADTLVSVALSVPPPAPESPSARTLAPASASAFEPDTMKPPPAVPVRPRERARYRRPVVALATAGVIAPAMAAAVYLWPAGTLRDVARALPQRSAGASAAPAATGDPVTALAYAPAARAAQPFDALAVAAAPTAVREPSLAAHDPEPSAAPARKETREDARGSRTRRMGRAARAEQDVRVLSSGGPAPVPTAGATSAEMIASAASEDADGVLLVDTRAQAPSDAAVQAEPLHGMAAAVPAAPAPPVPVPDASAPPAQKKAAPEAIGSLQASARINGVTVRGSLATSVVQRAIDRIRPQLAACYERIAKAAGRNAYGAVNVEVELDERGRASRSNAAGGALPGLDHCVTGVAGKLVARQAPDTGTVKATWQVTFERP